MDFASIHSQRRALAFSAVVLICLLSPSFGGAEDVTSVQASKALPSHGDRFDPDSDRSALETSSLEEEGDEGDGGLGTVQGNGVGCDWPFGGGVLRFQNCQTLAGGYKFNWNVSSDSVVTVAFSRVHAGWISWGISVTGLMKGSSAIIGYPDGSSGVSVNSYYLAEKSVSGVAPPGRFANLVSMKGEYVGGEVRLLTSLRLQPAEVSSSRLVWAHGPYLGTIREHQAYFRGDVSFSTGKTALIKGDNLKRNHGIINTVGWGLLLPLGAILARYGKSQDPAWFYAHVFIQVSGIGLGLAGFATGVILKNRSAEVRKTHFFIAVGLVVLSVIQMAAVAVRPKKDADSRPLWNFFHHWMGRIVFVVGAVNIYIGMDILEVARTYVIAYSMVIGVFLAFTVILEGLRVLLNLGNHGREMSGLLPSSQQIPMKSPAQSDRMPPTESQVASTPKGSPLRSAGVGMVIHGNPTFTSGLGERRHSMPRRTSPD